MSDEIVPDLTKPDAGYQGPDRRQGSIEQLGKLLAGVEALRTSVDELNESIGEMQEQYRKDEEKAKGWRDRVTRRAIIAAVLIAIGFGGLGGVAGWVAESNSTTSTDFKDFRQLIVDNCNVRNRQADGTRSFVSYLESQVRSNDTKTENAINAFLGTLPKDADCKKLAHS